MSDKEKPDLASRLPLASNETGILIKWNRENAMFEISFEGPALHYESFSTLMESVTVAMASFTNNEGVIVPSLPLDEQNASAHEMPINKQDTQEQPEDTNLPPWMKN